jgi:hypothetical protein
MCEELSLYSTSSVSWEVAPGSRVSSSLRNIIDGYSCLLHLGTHGLTMLPVFIANGYYKNITEFKREHTSTATTASSRD